MIQLYLVLTALLPHSWNSSSAIVDADAQQNSIQRLSREYERWYLQRDKYEAYSFGGRMTRNADRMSSASTFSPRVQVMAVCAAGKRISRSHDVQGVYLLILQHIAESSSTPNMKDVLKLLMRSDDADARIAAVTWLYQVNREQWFMGLCIDWLEVERNASVRQILLLQLGEALQRNWPT